MNSGRVREIILWIFIFILIALCTFILYKSIYQDYRIAQCMELVRHQIVSERDVIETMAHFMSEPKNAPTIRSWLSQSQILAPQPEETNNHNEDDETDEHHEDEETEQDENIIGNIVNSMFSVLSSSSRPSVSTSPNPSPTTSTQTAPSNPGPTPSVQFAPPTQPNVLSSNPPPIPKENASVPRPTIVFESIPIPIIRPHTQHKTHIEEIVSD